MPGIDLTSSSAVSRPPVRFEIVPPVATSRTRGKSVEACAAAGCGAVTVCASDRTAGTSVRTRRTMTGGMRARMAPLYLRGRPRMIERELAAELLARFVGRVAVERHHRARTAGNPGDLRAPFLSNRRYFDAVLTAIDGFCE